MILEAAGAIESQRILWLKACPEFDRLFQFLDCLMLDVEIHYWFEIKSGLG